MIIPSAIPAMSPIAKSTIVFPLSYARRRLVWRALEQTSCHGARFLGDATATGACALSRHSQNPTLLSLVPPDVAAASKASAERDRPGDAYGSLISLRAESLNRSPTSPGDARDVGRAG